MATLANYDYDTENSDITRRQKIADALQAQALQPMNLPLRGKASILNAVAPIVQALIASKSQEGLKADRAALTQRYSDDLAQGMQKFYDTSMGGTDTQMVGGPNPDGTDGSHLFQTARAPNPRQAIADALASNHPVLKEFAMKQMAEQAALDKKNQISPKDLLPYASPASILANQSDPSKWAPKANLDKIGDVVFDPETRSIVKLGGPEPTRTTIGGDLYQASPSTGEYKKLDNAPKVSVAVNPVIAGQKAGMQAYWEGAGKKVNALGEIAQQASNNKQTIAELRQLDANGIFSNSPTGTATFLSNLGQAVGVPVDVAKLGNTETYNALTTELWQGLVAKYGGNRGVTADEAKEIKKMLPLAGNSPQARQQLFNILDRLSNRQIAQYESANKSFAKAAKMDDPELFSDQFQGVFNPAPNTPSPTTPPTRKGVTVSNWKN